MIAEDPPWPCVHTGQKTREGTASAVCNRHNLAVLTLLMQYPG